MQVLKLLLRVFTELLVVLLVVMVPQIVPLKFVPTALGAHKSVSKHIRRYFTSSLTAMKIESAGSTLFQTVAGWLLDGKIQKSHSQKTLQTPASSSIQPLLNTWVFLNICQLLAVFLVSWLDRRQKIFAARQKYALLRPHDPTQLEPELGDSATPRRTEEGDEGWSDEAATMTSTSSVEGRPPSPGQEQLWVRSPAGGKWARHSYEKRVRRGEICALLCCAIIFCTWALFFVTAVLRLRSKGERGSTNSTLHH
jgi:hypothetical protein